MIDEVAIICNTFACEVDFFNFKQGSVARKIPSLRFPDQDFKPEDPAQGTILESGNVVLLDKSGFIIFGEFSRKLQ